MTHYYQKVQRPLRDAVLVFEAIKSRADDKTRKAFLDIREIATETRLDTASVSQAIDSLRAEQLIEAKTWPNAIEPYRYKVDVLVEDFQPRQLRNKYQG